MKRDDWIALIVLLAVFAGILAWARGPQIVAAQAFVTPTLEEDTPMPLPTVTPQPTAVVVTREIIATVQGATVWRIVDIQAQQVLYVAVAPNGTVSMWGIPLYQTRLSGVTP